MASGAKGTIGNPYSMANTKIYVKTIRGKV